MGCDFDGVKAPNCKIDILGLCQPTVLPTSAARPLYDYDVIIINPASYSHFIFGRKGDFSDSDNELWDLKSSNNKLDLDSVFDHRDRSAEMEAALKKGTRVAWLMSETKRTHFFGYRTLRWGYAHPKVEKIIENTIIRRKNTKSLLLNEGDNPFAAYFEQLKSDGWDFCLDNLGVSNEFLASSLEGYCIGVELALRNGHGWLLTPPMTEASWNELLGCMAGTEIGRSTDRFHGIFLSHTHEDKQFVKDLKRSLEEHGVERVWVDEAEIQIGDSLIKKIEEGITSTRYFGVVLSPRSIESAWVQKELEIALTKEIDGKQVIVLPLLMETCEIPPFLMGKLYADFTTNEKYGESLTKLLRRLKR